MNAGSRKEKTIIRRDRAFLMNSESWQMLWMRKISISETICDQHRVATIQVLSRPPPPPATRSARRGRRPRRKALRAKLSAHGTAAARAAIRTMLDRRLNLRGRSSRSEERQARFSEPFPSDPARSRLCHPIRRVAPRQRCSPTASAKQRSARGRCPTILYPSRSFYKTNGVGNVTASDRVPWTSNAGKDHNDLSGLVIEPGSSPMVRSFGRTFY